MAKYDDQIISLDNFKKSISGMIATSERAYNVEGGFTKGMKFSNYTREEVLKIIENGDPQQLKQVSLFYLYTSGFYRRFLIYYATLLKYIYLLVPQMLKDKKIEDKKYLTRYNKALEFMQNLNLKTLSKHIAIRTLAEGAYYGLLREYEDGVVVQDLPAEYCRSRFKNQFDVDIVEFNVSYFDTIRDKTTRDELLKGYPREIRSGYNKYKNRNESKWVVIEPGYGVYFTLVDERPFFSDVLPAIIDFNDYRIMEKEKDKQELNSLLIQELPIQDGELVFDPEEAEEIHRGSVNMLKNNKNTDVLTTFAKIKMENMESNRSVVTNNLEKIENSIYSEAGVSKQIFAAEGNQALNHSISNDMALMMILAEKIANWVQFLLKLKFSDNQMTFNVRALSITHYNEAAMRKDALSLAQSGYSFLIPALTFDIEQGDLIAIKQLEIDALQLNKIMLPLASSFTTSSGNPAQESDGSQNKIPDDQKSQKTIDNINSAS